MYKIAYGEKIRQLIGDKRNPSTQSAVVYTFANF
jgi:hypothetical protein